MHDPVQEQVRVRTSRHVLHMTVTDHDSRSRTARYRNAPAAAGRRGSVSAALSRSESGDRVPAERADEVAGVLDRGVIRAEPDARERQVDVYVALTQHD